MTKTESCPYHRWDCHVTQSGDRQDNKRKDGIVRAQTPSLYAGSLFSCHRVARTRSLLAPFLLAKVLLPNFLPRESLFSSRFPLFSVQMREKATFVRSLFSSFVSFRKEGYGKRNKGKKEFVIFCPSNKQCPTRSSLGMGTHYTLLVATDALTGARSRSAVTFMSNAYQRRRPLTST